MTFIFSLYYRTVQEVFTPQDQNKSTKISSALSIFYM